MSSEQNISILEGALKNTEQKTASEGNSAQNTEFESYVQLSLETVEKQPSSAYDKIEVKVPEKTEESKESKLFKTLRTVHKIEHIEKRQRLKQEVFLDGYIAVICD